MFSKKTTTKQKPNIYKNSKNFSFKKTKAKAKNKIPHLHLIKLIQKSFLIRAWLTFSIVLILMVGVYFRQFYIQIIEGDKYKSSSQQNYIKLIPQTPERGVITDRNGIGLAVNKQEWALFINPLPLARARKIFETLQSILDLNEDNWKTYLQARKNKLFKEPTILKSNLSLEEIAKLNVNRFDLEEINVQATYKRYYPYGTTLPHFLGYVGSIGDKERNWLKEQPQETQNNYQGTNQIGKLGIEKYYEQQLHGRIGFNTVEVNSTGYVVNQIDSIPALHGNNLRLAIDLPLQEFILKILKDEKAAVVVTNPKTSEILGIVSNPTFDANLFVDGISSKTYKALLEDNLKPLYNRATLGIYPPGSTVKPGMSFAGLASGLITKDTTIYDPGYWILPGTSQRYRDWLRSGHGIVNMHKAITQSVDTYFYELAYRMGIDRMAYWMKQMGFGSKTGIDIGEEASALYPTPSWKEKRFNRPWVTGDTIPVGIGQGYFTATPIQLVNYMNILINHGLVQAPHLLLNSVEFNSSGINKITAYTSKSKKVFTDQPESYFTSVLNGMWGVTNQFDGSGYKAFYGTSYKAGGKSGTAQVFNLNGGNYNKGTLAKELHDHALFIAFAPFEEPSISLSVIVENGGGGSKVAAPIARAIIDYWLNVRLPHLDSSLTCKQQQDYAVQDLAEQGFEVESSEHLYKLETLTDTKNLCVTNK